MATAINVASGSQAILTLGNTAPLAVPGASNGMVVPLVQDMTVGVQTNTVRYSTLDSPASNAFTTTNENTISLNILLDNDTFFGASNISNEVANTGILSTSVNKTEVNFSVAFQGNASPSYYVSGTGFISGLSPSASIDQAVWLSPMEIVVNGELTKTQL